MQGANQISTSYTKIPFNWKVMQEKDLQRPCNSTETHMNSSN